MSHFLGRGLTLAIAISSAAAMARAQAPDLTPIAFTVTGVMRPGAHAEVRVTIRNLGAVSSGPFRFEIRALEHFSSTSGRLVYQEDHPGVGANDQARVSFKPDIRSVPYTGTAWFQIRLDSLGRVKESNEGNNVALWRGRMQKPVARILAAQFRLEQAATQLTREVVDLTSLGDVDGDSRDDYAVSHRDAKIIRIHSGQRSTPIRTIRGTAERFGHSIASAGDADGDGVQDLVVGAPSQHGPGKVFLFSGRTGRQLFEIDGKDREEFGTSVSGVGDVDADGYDDFAAGAPNAARSGAGSGRVRIMSGRTGAVLHVYDGNTGSYFGHSIACAGDVDRDGRGDLLVGAPSFGLDRSAAYVISGASGHILRIYTPTSTDLETHFGEDVAVGDWDGDGTLDHAIGAPRDTGRFQDTGVVYVFSGKAGHVLFKADSPRRSTGFGREIAFVGDLDGNECDELLLSAPFDRVDNTSGGMIRVLGGPRGNLIHSQWGSASEPEFGIFIGSAGDINDDGVTDLLIGSSDIRRERGLLLSVFRSMGKVTGRSRSFGAACASGEVLPRQTSSGWPNLTRPFAVHLRTAPTNKPALFGLGKKATRLSLESLGAPGCVALTVPDAWIAMPTDAQGRANVAFRVPDDAKLVGSELFSQWTIFDGDANALGLVVSNGLRFRLGRP